MDFYLNFMKFVGVLRHPPTTFSNAPEGSPRTPTARIAATTPRLIIRILNSVF